MGEEDRDLVDFAVQEFLQGELRDFLRLGKRRRVLQRKIRQQLAARSDDKLAGFSTRRDVERLVRIELDRFAKKIGIERAGQALVGAEHDDQFLLHLTLLEERMQL